MTVSSTTAKVAYDGDGSSTGFSVSFPFFTAAELEVIERVAATGVETLKTLTTHYTVTGGDNDTGTVTMLVAPAVGVKLHIRRKTLRTQASAYPVNDTFPAATHERLADRAIALVQELEEIIGRSLRAPKTDAAMDFLPSSVARAGNALVFDASGNPAVGGVAFPASLTALYIPRVNAGGTSYELRSPAQTLGDIAAQPLDATLTALAGVTTAADKLIYATGSDTFSTTDVTSAARGLLDDASVSAMRTTLGVAIGTDVQAYDAELAAIAGLTSAADKVPYFTGSGTAALADLSSTGRSLIDDASVAAMRTTLGLVSGGAGDIWVLRAGDTMTGLLTLSADPSSALHAATKQYVDSAIVGLGKRGQARVATTANVSLSGGGIANGVAIDGVTLATGDIVLVKSQSAGAENGVYIVPASGAASRSTNYDTWIELTGALIAVEEGTTLADTLWLCTSNTGGTLDTTAVAWSQIFPGSGGTVTSIATAGMATGGTITSTGTITVDISALTASSVPLLSDVFAFYLASASAHRKVTLQQIFDRISALTQLTAGNVDGTADEVMLYDASASAAKYALVQDLVRGASGVAVQEVNTQTGAVATGTTLIPDDDTIPQNTEGDQVMTLSITPKSASNILFIQVTVQAAQSASGQMLAALFQDSTAGALAAAKFTSPAAGVMQLCTFTYKMAAGTTSSTTFKVRLGGITAGTLTFNGQAAARLLGGVIPSSITIKEFTP